MKLLLSVIQVLLVICGAAMLAYGVGLMYPPGGWIVGGLCAAVAGLLMMVGDREPDGSEKNRRT